MLASPVTPTVWRANTDNDRKIVDSWRTAGYDNAVACCRSIEMTCVTDKCVELVSALTLSDASKLPFLRLKITYTVLAEGGVVIHTDGETSRYSYEKSLPALPRFGYQFLMPEENEKIKYFGRGETESYEDLRHSSKLGIFQTTATKNFEHYIKPQENSAHYGCRYAAVSSVAGHGLVFRGNFSLSASHFTPEHLTTVRHDWELVPDKESTVIIDYRNSGIGSHSCGPELRAPYRIDEKEINFTFTFDAKFVGNTKEFKK
jgi:beta-galactosidase